jgi:hypothetical protein
MKTGSHHHDVETIPVRRSGSVGFLRVHSKKRKARSEKREARSEKREARSDKARSDKAKNDKAKNDTAESEMRNAVCDKEVRTTRIELVTN